MITKQKIKKVLTVLICMLVLTLTCVFHAKLHPFFIDLLANRFNIVSNKDNLMVHFIDVGQADAIAVNLPDGKVMLIDCGAENRNVTLTDYLKENVLSTKHNNRIDYLVLTHADMDHIGGALRVLKNFNVKKVFLPKVLSSSTGYAQILNYVDANCEYEVLGEEFEITSENYIINFFEILSTKNTNDSSQVVKIQSCNNSFLFCGDISAEVENLYVEKYGNELDADVLKVSHHGSSDASSQNFVEMVSPTYSVISVGKDNNYNHPTDEVLNNLKQANSKILRTDELSDIMFIVGENYNLKQLDGNYYIFSWSLDYAELVIVLDIVLLGVSLVIVFTKEKKKH